MAVTHSHPIHITSTAQRLDPATAVTKETTAPTHVVSGVSRTPALVTDATSHPKPSFEDGGDKILVASEEPPPIKAVRAAPGMSATSGPLEDFPEGEFR